jgi:DNA-binding response OmpR family regulator
MHVLAAAIKYPVPKRILIIEDQPTIGRALARIFEREGYAVDVARTHADSLAFQEQYHCGVFDIELPDSDGVDLASTLRARGVVKEIVFFSGMNDGKSEARARARGVYVHKTEGLTRLRNVVAALLGSAGGSA